MRTDVLVDKNMKTVWRFKRTGTADGSSGNGNAACLPRLDSDDGTWGRKDAGNKARIEVEHDRIRHEGNGLTMQRGSRPHTHSVQGSVFAQKTMLKI